MQSSAYTCDQLVNFSLDFLDSHHDFNKVEPCPQVLNIDVAVFLYAFILLTGLTKNLFHVLLNEPTIEASITTQDNIIYTTQDDILSQDIILSQDDIIYQDNILLQEDTFPQDIIIENKNIQYKKNDLNLLLDYVKTIIHKNTQTQMQ
ncbi:18815_t:CDS:2, partial [Gigaspora margarita]